MLLEVVGVPLLGSGGIGCMCDGLESEGGDRMTVKVKGIELFVFVSLSCSRRLGVVTKRESEERCELRCYIVPGKRKRSDV